MSNARTQMRALLVAQGMPEEEVSSVLSARDPRIVRRHLELHRERVIERQVDERNALDHLERMLVSRVASRTHPRFPKFTIEPCPEAPRRSGGRSPMPSWGPPASTEEPGSDAPRAFGSTARSTRCS